jgi:cysteine synthase A
VRVIAVEPAESNVLCGRPAGEHGIQGIGDGFVPALLNLDEVDEVRCVTTAEALATAGAIRTRHGFCVGASSGANTAVARELREQGLVVATVWPDSADRYGSLGLLPPTSGEVCCPHRDACRRRMRELLGSACPPF